MAHKFVPKGTLPAPATCKSCGLSGFDRVHDLPEDGVEWVDELPGPTAGRDPARLRETAEFAAKLRAHPGRWAVYPFPSPTRLAARATASRITSGRVAAFAEGFQGAVRGDVVYVRYEGGGQ